MLDIKYDKYDKYDKYGSNVQDTNKIKYFFVIESLITEYDKRNNFDIKFYALLYTYAAAGIDINTTDILAKDLFAYQ